MAYMEWETPQPFFDELNKEFDFSLDVCATKDTAKCKLFYSEGSLEKVWIGTCWMNPPYNNGIGKWMEKAYSTAMNGSPVVCLIQGRSTDTGWWHEYVMKSTEIRFIRDRLHFGKDGQFSRANISNVIVIFYPGRLGGPPNIGRTYDARDYKP